MEWLQEETAGAKRDGVRMGWARVDAPGGFSRKATRTNAREHGLAEKAPHYDPVSVDRPTVLRLIKALEAIEPARPKAMVMGLTLAGKPLLFDLENKTFHHMLIEEADEARAAEILRNLVCSLALTAVPAQIQLFPVDLGARELVALEGLPHSPRGMASDLESLRSLLEALAKEVRRRQENGSSVPHLVIAVHEIHLLPRRGLGPQLDALLAIAAGGGPLGVHLFMTGTLGTLRALRALEDLNGLTLVAPAPVVEGAHSSPLVIAAGEERTDFVTGEMGVQELDRACRQIALGGRLDLRPRGVELWPVPSDETAAGLRDVRGGHLPG
jgi:hypothetical protein